MGYMLHFSKYCVRYLEFPRKNIELQALNVNLKEEMYCFKSFEGAKSS